jgi:hypothetical protein
MSFLHFEAHIFCTNILFYDFCMESIEILWYCKFVMEAWWIEKTTKNIVIRFFAV